MIALEEHEFFYDVNGQKKTTYISAGPFNGPLLIFVHGWPAIAKTWKPQLTTFASLGFRVVAPDMLGYGGSSVPRKYEEYSQENINLGMLALLEHLGRDQAVWIGHDWGSTAVWTFAAHYPEKCVGVVAMCVPYHTLELGLEELLKYVNREVYAADKYPFGQWSYQVFYEQSFEKAANWMEADLPSFIRIGYSKGNPASYGKPSHTSTTVKDGGRAGGIPKPDPEWRKIPIEKMVLDEETYEEVVAALEKTGMWGADAWYMNHERNRTYSLDKWKTDGYLHMPALFIGAKFDAVCDTSVSRLCEPMRKYCTQLTETTIDAGHWVAEEKPAETNAAIARWLVESCKTYWPGYWSEAHAKA